MDQNGDQMLIRLPFAKKAGRVATTKSIKDQTGVADVIKS